MVVPLVILGQAGDRCGQEVVHCPERGASLLRHVFKWWPIDKDVLRNETDGQLTKKLFDLCGKLSRSGVQKPDLKCDDKDSFCHPDSRPRLFPDAMSLY